MPDNLSPSMDRLYRSLLESGILPNLNLTPAHPLPNHGIIEDVWEDRDRVEFQGMAGPPRQPSPDPAPQPQPVNWHYSWNEMHSAWTEVNPQLVPPPQQEVYFDAENHEYRYRTIPPPQMKSKEKQKGLCLHYLLQNWAYHGIIRVGGKTHSTERRKKVLEWVKSKMKPTRKSEPYGQLGQAYWDFNKIVACDKTGTLTDNPVKVRISKEFYPSRTEAAGADFQNWCTTACNDYTFYCHGSCVHYVKTLFESVHYHEIHHEVEKGWAQLNLIQWRDETWHNVQDPIERMVALRATGQIPQYHQFSPAWRDQPHQGKEIKYGIELEIWSPQRRDICTLVEELDGLGEQDGSLCRENGLEIISKPLTFQEIADEDGFWKKILKFTKGKCEGWPNQTGYGMHVSLSRAPMSEAHQVRLVCFIHANKRLCEQVASRNADRWAQFKSKRPDYSALECDKYEAASVRGQHRIEVRIFKSTINPSVFMRNVEFCAAVAEYTGSPMTDFGSGLFMKWIDGKGGSYPYLHKHLQQFQGKTTIPELNVVTETEEDDVPRSSVIPPRRRTVAVPGSPWLSRVVEDNN